jgi:hypothetical protein
MILGLMTEEEWDSKHGLLATLDGTKQLETTRSIIENYFSSESNRGTVALREFIDEYRPDIPDDYIHDFLDDLKEMYKI